MDYLLLPLREGRTEEDLHDLLLKVAEDGQDQPPMAGYSVEVAPNLRDTLAFLEGFPLEAPDSPSLWVRLYAAFSDEGDQALLVGEGLAAKPAPAIHSVVNVGSASGHTGSEFPAYAASKGGVIAYTKNLANRLAPQAIANSVDPGGVITPLNRCVMEDEHLWNQIMELTPLKRWATAQEIAEWIYFVGVTNRFMTGQSLLIDGGEVSPFNPKFAAGVVVVLVALRWRNPWLPFVLGMGALLMMRKGLGW